MSDEQERSASDLHTERREKLNRLRESGVEPFPHSFEGRTEIGAGVALKHERFDEGDDARPCGHPPLYHHRPVTGGTQRPTTGGRRRRPCMVAYGRGE
jgi:hypothetical protein